MQPLRIAMIGQRGVPAQWGGIERHVEEIGARLVDRGHEVIVYCRPGYAQDVGRTWRGMVLHRVPTVRTKHLDASVHSGVATMAALRERPDVVHYHALGPGVFAPVHRWGSPAVVVQTIHGFDDERMKWGPAARGVLRSARWMSARVPDAVIGVSAAITERYTAQVGPTGPIVRHIVNGVVRPGPVDLTRLDRWGLQPGRYALFVGRLVPEKHVALLLQAYRTVHGDLPLVIAGGSSFTDDYTAEIRRLAGLDPRVVLTDYVYGDDLAALYGGAGVFVLPSRLEGLPLTLLEALSHGCPVIVSDLPPHREVLGTGGVGRWIVPVGDRRSLAAALDAALTRAALDPIAARADAARLAEDLLGRFDWDDAARATEELYRDALDRRDRVTVAAEA